MEIQTVVGIDLAATLQRAKVGLAIVERQGAAFSLTSVGLVKTTWQILHAIGEGSIKRPVLLAVDAPLKLPLSEESSERESERMEGKWPMVYTYRPWEHLVFEKLKREYGISGRPFSSLSITHRAQVLKGLLERQGWKLISSPHQVTDQCFTEVFPNLTIGILEQKWRADEGVKGKEERRKVFVSRLLGEGYLGLGLVDGLGREAGALMGAPDVLDAIVCAWTGALLAHCRVRPKVAICLGDDTWGSVVCPYTKELEAHLSANLAYTYQVY